MADLKISQLTGATTPLAGTEVLPIVQSSATVKVATDDLTVKNIRSNATTGILQIAGPGAGATRTMTTPDANFTAARTDAAQTFTGMQSFAGSTQNVRVYGGSAAHQWDIYGNGNNLRVSDNTGGGFVQFDTDLNMNGGNVVIGTSGKGLTSTGTIICQSSSSGGNWQVFSSASSTNPAYFIDGNGTVNGIATGVNGAASAMYVNKDSGSARSINAAGSLNASGADYAEYETKNDDCGQVAKGQIVGFDQDGKLTDKWAQAKSFAVKTTNPSYVGGDTWGNEEAIGPRPEDIADNATPEEVEQYELAMSAWKEKLEAARQKVDRIAYAGKVPCNVMGAKVGDYIIAVQNGEAIDGRAVEVPTFDQYRFAVGKVRSILSDGRCEIAVIVH